MKEVELPSGATLIINDAPFADARALYQSVLREFRALNIGNTMEAENLGKDLLCIGFSSPEIEACLWTCFKRCTYQKDAGSKPDRITEDTFEPVAARDDYLKVCMEVAKENIIPFGKSLYVELKAFLASTLIADLKSSLGMTS